MKTVIFKEMDTYKSTTSDNYAARIRNAREVCTWNGFDDPHDIISYLCQYCGRKADDFIIIEG